MAETKGNADNKVYIDLHTGEEKKFSGDEISRESGTSAKEWSSVFNWNGHYYDQATIENITNLYMYGQTIAPSNLEDRLRSPEEIAKQLVVRINMQTYLDSAGKYAMPANTKFVEIFMKGNWQFCANREGEEPGVLLSKLVDVFFIPGVQEGNEYSVLELIDMYLSQSDEDISKSGITFSDNDDLNAKRNKVRNILFGTSYVHAQMDKDNPDYYHRTWIYGTDNTILSWDTKFKFDANKPSMSNVKMMPRDDDFDFESAKGSPTELYNRIALKQLFDRFDIGSTVKFEYEGREDVLGLANYMQEDYDKEKAWYSEKELYYPSMVLGGIDTAFNIKEQLKQQGMLQDKTDGEKEIIYGSWKSDLINERYLTQHKNNTGEQGDDPLYPNLPTLLNDFNLSNDKKTNRSIIAGDGDDTVDMSWTTGNNDIHGGRGNDILKGGSGNDKIYGDYRGEKYDMYGEGTAFIDDVYSENNGSDELYGGAGDDELYGGAGGDKLYGDDGNDILYGELGSDILYGGSGNE